MAASFTVRVIGPAVSCVLDIGIMPVRLHKPTVGFIPTNPLTDDGETTDPSVSVPIAIAQRFAAAAEPEPALDPLGFLSKIYGHLVCPPLLLQALVECVDLKLAHSLKLVLPSNTAPASRSFLIIKASCLAIF